MINVFRVEKGQQQRLVDLLICNIDDFVKEAPGFQGATLHRSLDGMKVTMYAQWESLEHCLAMRQDPCPLPFLAEALSFAMFKPAVYEIVARFVPVAPAP